MLLTVYVFKMSFEKSLYSTFAGEVNGNAMTPASRVSAINIVGDLLRKVGVSESNAYSTMFKLVVVTLLALASMQYLDL